MKSEFVTLIIDDVVVVGQVTCRQTDFISVQLISPYWGWKNHSSITGQARGHFSFLTSLGDETARDLLQDTYLKIKAIDESIVRICNVYDDLLEEVRLLEKMPKTDTRRRIIDKLRRWFYTDFLFTSSVTGRVAACDEVDIIKKIITTYKATGKKLYLRDDGFHY